MLSSTSQEENTQVQCSPVQDLCKQECMNCSTRIAENEYLVARNKQLTAYIEMLKANPSNFNFQNLVEKEKHLRDDVFLIKDYKIKQLNHELESLKETLANLNVENEGLKQKEVDVRRKVVACNEKANFLREELKSAKLIIQALEKESEEQFNFSLDIEALKKRSEKEENKAIRELHGKCEKLMEQLQYRNISYKILQDQMNKMEIRRRETSEKDEKKINNSSSKFFFEWFSVPNVFSCNILICLFILSFLLFRLVF